MLGYPERNDLSKYTSVVCNNRAISVEVIAKFVETEGNLFSTESSS